MTRLTGTDAWGLMEAYNAVYEPQEITEEQIWEEVELWVNSLLEEGYDLSECTWEDLYDYYIEEGYKRMDRDKIFKQINKLNKSGKNAQASTLDILSRKLDTPDEATFSTRESRRNKKGGSERSKRKHLQARDDAKKDIEKYGFHEEVDLYDVILTHLLDEGYADTHEDAVSIMANMSEDWKESILGEILDEELTGERKERAEKMMKELRPHGKPRKSTNKKYGQLSRVARAKEGSSDAFRVRETLPTKRGGRMPKGSVKTGWDGDFQADRPKG